ncbi:AbrB/MazE/SpoVT family DNA-binding domain-containing protein [Bacillaceae bacterium Marseille-Q3522]|nr:AbrB/MazE/SpoVT family DNA-binding domain-containing protein [Bacillaceae bacterium Marseille-Q3522]
MKATGVVRKVDQLGRVVIPKELRGVMDININDSLEIFTENESVILQKYTPVNQCAVTEQIEDDNFKVAKGSIVLSKVGAKLLAEEIKEKFQL